MFQKLMVLKFARARVSFKMPNSVGTWYVDDNYEGDYVTVAQYLNPTDAHIVSMCLEAAGITAIVADANLVQTNSLWAIAVGGVRIRVPEMHVAEAEDVIAAFNRGDYALADEEDSGQK
jgi:hypothetical protein